MVKIEHKLINLFTGKENLIVLVKINKLMKRDMYIGYRNVYNLEGFTNKSIRTTKEKVIL